MNTSERTALIAAAAAAAGPVDGDLSAWTGRVRQIAGVLTIMARDDSPLAARLDQLANGHVKSFIGTLVGGKREESSTRYLLRLRTRPSEQHPDGIETVRTERTDSPEGAQMVAALKPLTGHRLRLYVLVEEASPGKRVRVITHFEDLGPDPSANVAGAAN